MPLPEIFEQRFRPNHCHLAYVNEDSSNIVRKKSEKDWKSREIGFFNTDYKEPALIL